MSSFLIVSLVKGGEVAAKQFSNSPNGLCKALPISERKKKIRKVLQGPQKTKEQIKQDDICLFLLQNMQLHDHMNNMLLVTYKLAILESYISLRDRWLHSLCNSVRTLLYK